jgi:hypothetical protein
MARLLGLLTRELWRRTFAKRICETEVITGFAAKPEGKLHQALWMKGRTIRAHTSFYSFFYWTN